MGGVARTLDIAADTGLDVVVSSALETSIGLAQGVAAAAALPALPYACGLATAHLLGADVVADSVLPIDGALTYSPIAPDESLIGDVPLPPDLAKRWVDRLAAMCQELS